MNKTQLWLEENFDRVEKSMTGSCVTVTYLPKKSNVLPCNSRTPSTSASSMAALSNNLLLGCVWQFLFSSRCPKTLSNLAE